MYPKLQSQDSCIYEYPTQFHPLAPGEKLTIGDLHANAIKLLHYWIKHQIIEMSKADFDRLVEIYCETVEYAKYVTSYYERLHTDRKLKAQLNKLKKSDVSDKKQKASLKKQMTDNDKEIKKLANKIQEDFSIKTILNWLSEMKAILSPEKIKKLSDCLTCLIGDEVGDRGPCELFYLFLKMCADELDIEVTTLLSNHGLNFITAFEKKLPFSNGTIKLNQMSSMLGMHTMIKKMEGLIDKIAELDQSDPTGVASDKYLQENDLNLDDLKRLRSLNVTRVDIDESIAKHYYPNLKLIDAEICQGKVIIFSHAPIGWETIQDCVTYFNSDKFKSHPDYFSFEFKAETKEDLLATIQLINKAFQLYSKENGQYRIHDLYEPDSSPYDSKVDPIGFICWNRDYQNIHRKERHMANNAISYEIDWVNGHDTPEILNPHEGSNIYNLDNSNGKYYDKGYRKEVLACAESLLITRPNAPALTLDNNSTKTMIATNTKHEIEDITLSKLAKTYSARIDNNTSNQFSQYKEELGTVVMPLSTFKAKDDNTAAIKIHTSKKEKKAKKEKKKKGCTIS